LIACPLFLVPTDEDIEIENPITRSQQYQEAIENAIQGRATRSTSGTSDEESSKKRAPKRSQKQGEFKKRYFSTSLLSGLCSPTIFAQCALS
jgi:hypothetical protein